MLLENKIKQEEARATRSLKTSVKDLTSALQALEKKVASFKQLPTKPVGIKAPLLTKPEPSDEQTKAPVHSPPKERSIPKPGELIEQDIR